MVCFILLLMIYKSCVTLRTLNYGNYGIFLILGNARFISSTVVWGSGFRVFGVFFRVSGVQNLGGLGV